MPNEVTRANAGGRRRLSIRARWAARIAQFCRWAVRFLPLIVAICVFVGCASDSSSRSGLAGRYQAIHVGMTRDEVYKLLGKPHGGYAQGGKDVVTEVWIDRLHGQANRLCVLFGSDGRARGVDQDTVVMP
jgi:hypothetical protein